MSNRNKMTKIDEDQNFTYYLVEINAFNSDFQFRIKVDKVTNIPYINMEDIITASNSDKTLHDFFSSDSGLDMINNVLKENPGMKFSDLFI